jgi:hypothetical protein
MENLIVNMDRPNEILNPIIREIAEYYEMSIGWDKSQDSAWLRCTITHEDMGKHFYWTSDGRCSSRRSFELFMDKLQEFFIEVGEEFSPVGLISPVPKDTGAPW